MLKFKALIGILIFATTYPVQAQSKRMLGIQFNNYHASKSFQQNITRNPIGVAIVSIIDPTNNRFQYGLELGFGLYSGKKYFYETVAEGMPGNYVYLYEEDGFISYKALIRYKLTSATKITPYLECKLGANTFFSAVRTLEVSSVYADRTRIHDTALNVGGGLGFYFDVGKILFEKDWVKPLYIDFSGTYLFGSNVRYRNAIQSEIVDSFESGYRKSRTDAIQYKFGFTLAF